MTRTFEIRVVVARSPAMAPGMLRDATVVFRQVDAPGLPVSALGLRKGKRVVFIVKDGKVMSVPVEAGLTWNGFVEIRNAASLAAADIVVEGMLLLNEGDAVRTEK